MLTFFFSALQNFCFAVFKFVSQNRGMISINPQTWSDLCEPKGAMWCMFSGPSDLTPLNCHTHINTVVFMRGGGSALPAPTRNIWLCSRLWFTQIKGAIKGGGPFKTYDKPVTCPRLSGAVTTLNQSLLEERRGEAGILLYWEAAELIFASSQCDQTCLHFRLFLWRVGVIVGMLIRLSALLCIDSELLYKVLPSSYRLETLFNSHTSTHLQHTRARQQLLNYSCLCSVK